MSYDVLAGGEWLNYTSNMVELFQDFGVYPPNWDGQSRREVGAALGVGLRALVRERNVDRAAFDHRYDSPNGWGSVETALKFLLQVYLACFYEVPETLRVLS